MTLRRSITNELMRQAALDTTYERGRDLYRFGSARIVDISREAGFADVGGIVAGSRGGEYHATVIIDEQEEKVVDSSCSCPASDSYKGMCKHAIALSLEYLDLVSPSDAPAAVMGLDRIPTADSAFAAARHARQQAKPAPAPKPKPVRTSQAVRNLLASYASIAQEEVRRASAAAGYDAPDEEPVDLQCVISSGESAYRYSWSTSDTWSLGLKVVRGKTSYVVKNIGDLVDAWHFGEVVRYGKNLEFAHRRSAFTDRANALLALLSDVVEAQQSLYVAQESRYYGGDRRLSAKTLPL